MTRLAVQDTMSGETPHGIMHTAAGLTFARTGDLTLQDAPINPDWILEGAPRARALLLAQGADRRANMSVWDCTAGRFHWYFGCDEAVHIVEGSVKVTDASGDCRLLEAGDAAWFPAYSWFTWEVEDHVRKVAFCHDAVPLPARFPLRVLTRLTQVATRLSTAVFGSSRRPPR